MSNFNEESNGDFLDDEDDDDNEEAEEILSSVNSGGYRHEEDETFDNLQYLLDIAYGMEKESNAGKNNKENKEDNGESKSIGIIKFCFILHG